MNHHCLENEGIQSSLLTSWSFELSSTFMSLFATVTLFCFLLLELKNLCIKKQKQLCSRTYWTLQLKCKHGLFFSQRSAPMNIPEKSRICRNISVGESSFHGDGSSTVRHYYDDFQEEKEYEEDGDGMIPPHKWIEKRVARRQVSSFSMCEGIGRTLKVRDLSKVRNDVLARTGFLD